MALLIVPPEYVNRAWETEGADILAESCTADECTPSQLKMILSRGERTLVQVKNGDEVVGWGCYRIDQMPNIRVLHITNMVGHNSNFISFFDEIRAIARAYGCSRIRCSCSPTHARLYRIKAGMTPVYETVECFV